MNRWLWILTGMFVFAGCGSISAVRPEENPREGLFDVMAKLKEAPGGDRPNVLDRIAGKRLTAPELKWAREFAHGWTWPLKKVRVTSGFGERGSRFHDGVDLRAAVGTPVHAVSEGKVVYSSSQIGGYGRMVVIRHAGNLFSVYAHHSRNLVRKGQAVKRGQQIALSGSSGRSRGAHLHFEVRRGVVSLDPVAVLGPTSEAAKRRSLAREEDSALPFSSKKKTSRPREPAAGRT